MNIGVVGATGMVGEVFMKILGESRLRVKNLRPFASDKSAGQKISACNREWTVETLKPNCFSGLDLVFFSSGDDISKTWAPQAVESGAFAVDNSAAFRMDPRFPLIVPEVNGDLLKKIRQPTIIANPNCSTIQLVVVLKALQSFGLKRVRVATYQSVSGAGKPGRDELMQQVQEQVRGAPLSQPATFPHPIAFNCIPQIGSFNEEGFCSEEVKIMNETKKIMSLPELMVSAFTVRIPSLNAHSEAAWVTFAKDVSRSEIYSALENAAGIKFFPDTKTSQYPTALAASGEHPVFVGRVHKDLAEPNTWMMWIVADNILKGAALNGLQIAEEIFVTHS